NAASDATQKSRAGVGRALAQLATDDADGAAARLEAAGDRTNLPLTILKLAWRRLVDGDAAGAAHELARAGNTARGQIARALELVRALVAIDNRQWVPALASLRTALVDPQPWYEPATRPLLEAY